MEVETFEVLESAEMQSPEFAEEAVRLIEELGLEGQSKLLVKREGSGVVTLNPYRVMTNEERFAYKTLCPSTSTPEAYSSGAMPLRVMQVLAHAKGLGCFKSFEVWHPTDSTVKDPVLVGLAQNPEFDAAQYPWMTRTHILARWGEVLDDLPTLMRMAAQKYRNKLRSEINEAQGIIRNATAALDADDDSLAVTAMKHSQLVCHW